ncbi:MAG: tetratricopeptide repeat protein [Nitrososphaerota archaeon]
MKGLKAYRKGDFERALNFFQKVRSLEPDVPAVHHNIATAYMKLRDFKRAEKHLLEALNLDSKYTFALISLANLRLELGRLNEAWNFFSSAAEICLEDGLPSNPEEKDYLLRTLFNLTSKGEIPRENRETVEELLNLLIEELPAREAQPLMLLKIAVGFEREVEKWRERDLKRRLKMKSTPINPDSSLEELLSRYNKYALVGMGKRLQLKGSLEALKKSELAERISKRLRDSKFLEDLLEELKPIEKDALTDLMFKGGAMPWEEFAEKYGNDIEESIYWNWHPPETLMGRLKATGLIAEGSLNGKEWIIIPKELKPLITTIQKRN